MMEEGFVGRFLPTAAAASGMLHAVIVLGMASQVLVTSPLPWQLPDDEVPLVELSIVQAEPPPAAPAVDVVAPARTPDLIGSPPPPAPKGPDLADLPPLPSPPPASPAPQSATTGPAEPRQAHEEYMAAVVQKLSHTRYTPHARLPMLRAAVVTRITMGRDGQLLAARLVRSSGSPEIDNVMMEVVRLAAPFPRPPSELAAADGNAGEVTLTVPMTFTPVPTYSRSP